MKKPASFVLALCVGYCVYAQEVASIGSSPVVTHPEEEEVIEHSSNEKHIGNLQQLTFGGDNAEACFSFDGRKLTFQSNNPVWGLKCGQVFWMDIEEAADNRIYQPLMVSNGEGKSSCGFYLSDNRKVVYASTFKGGAGCPEPAKPGAKNIQLHPDFDIFIGDEKGKLVKQLTESPGYDAEAVISPKGDKILFTSMRDGDPELYIMDLNGKNVKRLTHTPGYDGGAFFSADGTKIVFRASRPQDTVAYKTLLQQGLVPATGMEVFMMNADGSGQKQLTRLGKTVSAPFFHPSGKKIIFSSDHQKEGEFQLFTIGEDGAGLEQITFESRFNGYPVFSPDGRKIVFSSNRNNGGTNDTNMFIADWVD